MLVEINLLPQKEPKKFNILYLSTIIVIFVIVGGIYYWQIQTAKTDVEALDKQITATKKITEKEESKANVNEASQSSNTLKIAVDWARDYPVPTIPVMKELTSLLPERGFIQSFAYAEAGTVTLTVQFDSSREAAFFLNSLKDSEWIKDASLSSLNAVEKKEETTAASQTTPGQAQQAVATQVQEQPAEVVVQNNPASPTQDVAAAQNPASTPAQTASTTQAVDDNILPRYVGQFEIQLNKDRIKELLKKDKEDEEGVTGS
jgi:Tfp pilus assembly protein PilN